MGKAKIHRRIIAVIGVTPFLMLLPNWWRRIYGWKNGYL